jgi:class 3 adenylate cyclase
MSETFEARESQVTARQHAAQLRLLLEELCSDLCRFIHLDDGSLAPEDVSIDREAYLGIPDTFADIRVRPKGGEPYFVEVKVGYPDDLLVRHLGRKYHGKVDGATAVGRLVLVVDLEGRTQWPRTLQAIRDAIRPGIELEVWDERGLLERLRQCFSVSVESISAADLLEVAHAIDRAKGFHAFGGTTLRDYEHDPLKAELMWHFGFWRLRQLREQRKLGPRQIMPPGLYRNVAVVMADMCAFSSYMRDTSDATVTREILTAFYSRARYQIINRGGMLYQFVGDEVIGLFGLPEPGDDAANDALDTACALASIGASVSNSWQRQIDRAQTSAGLHIGLALGDVQIVALRPYSRTHIGALGDCINVAARVMGNAGPGEIIATNSFVRQLDEERRSRFAESAPMEAKNVGRINCWKMGLDCGCTRPA